MARDQAVRCHCATFHRKLVQVVVEVVVEEEVEEALVVLCRVRRIEVFIEVSLQAIQNRVDEFHPVSKRFVSKNRIIPSIYQRFWIQMNVYVYVYVNLLLQLLTIICPD